MTRPIVSPKTLAAEAEGRLPKNFGISRLCSALVILCSKSDGCLPQDYGSQQHKYIILPQIKLTISVKKDSLTEITI